MGSNDLVIYEVNLAIDPETSAYYLAWLKDHIKHILTLDGFTSAEIFNRKDPDEAEKLALKENPTLWSLYTVQYRVKTLAHLNDYLTNHAATMRKEGIDRFGGKFNAYRRILQRCDAISS
eukprot:TRINITY_DN3826_c0_g1_i2.p1 TRINITY_DN3826_c0_g1~~TRINITY_DN3826_c0_g1_i2.p1  ORF type:complete len:120 (+),score=1.15 TRINITY_DN3826_c0_g1_i2:68-427(+)